MNAMPKAPTYKRVRSSAAVKRDAAAKPSSRQAEASATASRTTRYRRILAEMDAQIAQIKATLDDAERIMDEVNAG